MDFPTSIPRGKKVWAAARGTERTKDEEKEQNIVQNRQLQWLDEISRKSKNFNIKLKCVSVFFVRCRKLNAKSSVQRRVVLQILDHENFVNKATATAKTLKKKERTVFCSSAAFSLFNATFPTSKRKHTHTQLFCGLPVLPMDSNSRDLRARDLLRYLIW